MDIGNCEFNSVSVEKSVGAVVPVVTITTPADDVDVDASVVASSICKDTGGYTLASCTATLNSDAIETTTAGVKTLAVTGTDSSGNTLTSNLEVTVIADEFAKGTGVTGSVSPSASLPGRLYTRRWSSSA